MSIHHRIALLTLIVAGASVRVTGLFANTFHADEALFASWARLISVWSDPLLSAQAVDKPPLLFYLQALLFPLFGAEDWVARLPGWIASLLLIPLSARLAMSLYRSEVVAVSTAVFVTLSPLLIQFSPTAFIDPLLATLLVGALWAAAAQSARRAAPPHRQKKRSYAAATVSGILFGLALASKYQALLFFPLIMALALIGHWRRSQLWRWVLGFIAVVGSVLIWDIARSGGFSLWSVQMSSYGGLRLAWSWELWPRLVDWVQQWGYLLHAQPTGFASALVLLPVLVSLIGLQGKGQLLDRAIAVFLVAYFALHWLVAIPVWERYVVPTVPLVGLLLARWLVRLVSLWAGRVTDSVSAKGELQSLYWLVPLFLFLLQGSSAVMAREGRLPVGGRPSADGSAAELATSLDDAPYGTVLYDHWFSWQWRYHLLDSRVYVSWFPDPVALVEDLTVFGREGPGRFVAVPDGPESLPVLRALREARYHMLPVEPSSEDDFTRAIRLYRIIPNGR